jgi:hypothetical protein
MISYAKWQKLNESMGYTLGLRPVQSLGLVGAHTQVEDGDALEEAKKKKMLAGGDDMGMTDDSGDGETVPPKSEKDLPSSDDFPKKPGSDADDDGDGEDDGEDDEDGEDSEENDRGLPPKPMFSKKKMSKDDKCSTCGSDPCKCPKKGSKKKNEWLEEFKKGFMSDLQTQLGQGRNTYSDGWEDYKEDALLLAFGQQDDEVPGPGEIGYAPTGRIGAISQSDEVDLPTLGEGVKKK